MAINNKSNIVSFAVSLYHLFFIPLTISILIGGLIIPPKFAFSASQSDKRLSHLPFLNLLLTNEKGYLALNSDPTSPVLIVYQDKKGIIEVLGTRDQNGNPENVTGLKVQNDGYSALFSNFTVNNVTVTVTYGNGSPKSFILDVQPAIKSHEFATTPKAPSYCYDNITLPVAPPEVVSSGDIVVKECSEVSDTRSNYEILFKSFGYREAQLVEQNKISVNPDNFTYTVKHYSNKYPYYNNWFNECRSAENLNGIISGLLGVVGGIAIGAVLAPAILAAAIPGIATIGTASVVATGIQGIVAGGIVVYDQLLGGNPCDSAMCTENGEYATGAKEKYSHLLTMQVSARQVKGNDKVNSNVDIYFPNRNAKLPTLTAEFTFTAPENGTGIPPGTYSGTGEWTGTGLHPGLCLPGFTVTVDQDGNVTSTHIDECFTGSGGGVSYVHPVSWQLTPATTNPTISLTAFGGPLFTSQPVSVTNNCNSQTQNHLTPSGNFSSYSLSADRDIGTSALQINLSTFAYFFVGQAQ